MGIILKKSKWLTLTLVNFPPLNTTNFAAPMLLFSSTTENSILPLTSSTRSLRPPVTPLRATGPDFSPRPSRDKTSKVSSATCPLDLLPPALLLDLPLVVTNPLKRKLKRKKKKRKLMSIWEVSSAATTNTEPQASINKNRYRIFRKAHLAALLSHKVEAARKRNKDKQILKLKNVKPTLAISSFAF